MGKVERAMLNDSGYEVWMRRRETEFCDDVDPVQVHIVDGENVVWTRRSGISEKGFYDYYHIGCDHLGRVPRGESEIQAMLGCSAVQQVLRETANTTTAEIFNLKQVLPNFIFEEDGEIYLDEQGEEIASLFVFEALVKTIEEPAICHGNIRSGVHVRPILQYMLGGVTDGQFDEIIRGLHYQGLVHHEDPLVAIAA